MLRYPEESQGSKRINLGFFKSDEFACTRATSLYNEQQSKMVRDIRSASWQKSSHGSGYFVEAHPRKNVPDREVGRAGGGK